MGDEATVRALLATLSEPMTAASYQRSNMSVQSNPSDDVFVIDDDDNNDGSGSGSASAPDSGTIDDVVNMVANYPQHPIFCCAITGNHNCLHEIALHMDEIEFAMACCYNPGTMQYVVLNVIMCYTIYMYVCI